MFLSARFSIAWRMAFDSFCRELRSFLRDPLLPPIPLCRDETLIMPGISVKTALLCLDRIYASDGVDTQNVGVDCRDDVEDCVLPLDSVIALARKSGFELRSATFDWRALLAATATKTVLLVLRNANVVLVLGTGREGAEEIVVSDPLYQNGVSFFLPRQSLEHAWEGEVLILKRKRNKLERTVALWLSILSICGLLAGLLLVSHALIDRTLAGSHSLPHGTSAAVASTASTSAAASNDTQPIAGTTNADVQRRDDPDIAQPSTLTSSTASPEIRKADSVGEPQSTEQPVIGGQPTPEASTVAPENTQERSPAVEESGAKSAQLPGAEAPQISAASAVAPTVQTDAVSQQIPGLSFSPEEVAALVARGDTLVTKGDVASARLFYERAAEAADSGAALRLAESYDPAFLARAHVGGARGDLLAAARWYRRARELGRSEAEVLLKTLAPKKDQ
jgi:hypothetical protein